MYRTSSKNFLSFYHIKVYRIQNYISKYVIIYTYIKCNYVNIIYLLNEIFHKRNHYTYLLIGGGVGV